MFLNSKDSTKATAVLNYVTDSGAVDSAAAIEVNTADGRKELHCFMDSASWAMHSTIINPIMLLWATRGAYVGSRRIRLSMQTDDVFLDTETWVANLDEDGSYAYRLTGPELQHNLDYYDYLSTVCDCETMTRNAHISCSNFLQEAIFSLIFRSMVKV